MLYLSRTRLSESTSASLFCSHYVSNAKLLTCHLCALNSVSNLLECNLSCVIRTPMLWFDINAERTESTIIRGAELIRRNVLTCLDEAFTNLLWRFDCGIEGVDDADKGHLLDAIGVCADRFADLFIYLCFVLLRRELDQEITRIHLEHGWKQLVIIDVIGVDRVAIAAWTGVDADILTLFWREAVKNIVVEVHERLEQICTCPWIPWVVLSCEAAFSEIYRHALSTSFEAASDVFLASIDEIFHELFLWVALNCVVERIKEVQHARCDDRLLHWISFSIRLRLLQVLVRVGFVLE